MTDVRATLNEIFTDVLGYDESEIADTSATLEDLEVDSLVTVEIVTQVQQRLGVIVDEADLRPTATIADLYEVVHQRYAAVSA